MSTGQDSANHRQGFSLVELAVVLVLLGLIVSITLPRFSGITERERLRTAARRLAGMALEAYSESVTRVRPFFFCLDLENRQAWLSTVRPGREGEAGIASRKLTLPMGVNILDAEHPGQGVVKEGRLSFGFSPQGGNEPGTIHLADGDGRKMTLFIRPYLGRTEIREGYLREEYR